MIKKVSINIILIITICIIVEVIFSFFTYNDLLFQKFNKSMLSKNKIIGWIKSIDYFSPSLIFQDEYISRFKEFRKPVGTIYKTRPIIIFGCSFAYGDQLNQEQTFSYKLSKLTKRPVYNYAHGGWGVQHPIYILQKDKSMDKIKNPEYIIFVLISDHYCRLYSQSYYPDQKAYYLKYPIKNGKVMPSLEKIPFYYKLYTVKVISHYLAALKIHTRNEKESEKISNDLNLTILKWNAIAKKKYPGVKTIIIQYPSDYSENTNFDLLKKNGIEIINFYNLKTFEPLLCNNNGEYSLPDGHPNEKAWDMITPYIVKKLHL